MKNEVMIVREFKVGLFRTPVTVSCDINGKNVKVESSRELSSRQMTKVVSETLAEAVSKRLAPQK